jgi:hypothetical protein
MRDKVAYIFRSKARFLHVREIANIIGRLDGLSKKHDTDKLLTQVRNIVSWMKREGAIVKYSAGKQLRNSFWGSTNWIKDGDIVKGHEYDSKFVYKSKKESIVI